MRSSILKIILTTILVTLGGSCAGAPNDGRIVDFPAGSGLAIVRVVTNTASINAELGLNNRWSNLYVRSEDGSKQTLTQLESGGRRSTQVFSGFLPKGRYELLELDLYSVKKANLTGQGLTFEVKPSQITNLGSIIYQSTGNHGFAIIRSDKDDGLSDVIGDAYAPLNKGNPASQLAFDGPLPGNEATLGSAPLAVTSGSPLVTGVGTATTGIVQSLVNRMTATQPLEAWSEATDPAARLSLAKNNTYALNSIVELPGGELVAASNLGQLLIREPSGDWLRLSVGDSRELTAIYARDRLNMIVGGEEGQLYLTADGGMNWKRVQLPATNGLIVSIQENHGEFLILSQEGHAFVLRSTQALSEGTWTELKRFEFNGGNFFGLHTSVQNIATIQGNKYIVVIPNKSVHILDLGNKTWKSIETDGWYREIKLLDNQTLLASGGNTVAPHVSTDSGATWNEMRGSCAGLRSRVVSIGFSTPQTGYMLCHSNGMFSGGSSLRKTGDGGQSWQDSRQKFPILVGQLVVTKQFILYVDILNRIYVSKDGGGNWTLERGAN